MLTFKLWLESGEEREFLPLIFNGNQSALLVYADWLQDRGDPLGEAIASYMGRGGDSTPFWQSVRRKVWASPKEPLVLLFPPNQIIPDIAVRGPGEIFRVTRQGALEHLIGMSKITQIGMFQVGTSRPYSRSGMAQQLQKRYLRPMQAGDLREAKQVPWTSLNSQEQRAVVAALALLAGR